MPISRRALLGGCAAALAPLPAQNRRPNVLVIYSDDQTFRSIHALNNPEIQTPNLDRLMARGTTFTHACIMGGLQPAVCVPSRAMLLSGQTLFHVTARIEGKPEWGPKAPFDLWPEVLGNNGYQTIGVGKWHNGPVLYHRAFQKGGPILFGGMSDHYKTPVHDFNPAKEYPKTAIHPREAHSSEVFADAAIRHIRERDKSKPFALYLAFTAPHDPRQAPEKFRAMYPPEKMELPPNFLPEHPFDNGELKVRDEALLPWPRTPEAVRKERSDYYAMISHMDEQVGRIFDTLDREGLRNNTLVIFAGDNGLAVGEHGLLGKQSLYDHSIRVPFLMAGPGVPAGKRTDSPVYLFDIFPTMMELLGLPVPATVDGKSLVPVLKDPKKRVRDGQVFAYRHFQRALRTSRWKYIRYNAGGAQHKQLFDLAADPFERNDLSAKPEMGETVTQLDILMRMLLKEAGDSLDLTKPDWGWKA